LLLPPSPRLPPPRAFVCVCASSYFQCVVSCRRGGDDDFDLDDEFDVSDDEDGPGGPGGKAFT